MVLALEPYSDILIIDKQQAERFGSSIRSKKIMEFLLNGNFARTACFFNIFTNSNMNVI